MRSVQLVSALLLLLGMLASDASAQPGGAVCAVSELAPSDPDGSFYRPVTISGDRLAVAWPSGVHIFRLDGSVWTEEAVLLPPDPPAGDTFGVGLSMDGDCLAVGAPSTAVFVFERSGTNWVQQVMLTPFDGATGNLFGRSVSLKGDVLVASAHYDDDGCPAEDPGCSSGAVYVFRRDGTGWVPDAKIANPDPDANDLFGWSVSTDGDRIAVGVPNDDAPDGARGSAYVFSRDAGTWSEETRVWAAAEWYFGVSVSLDGPRLGVGAALGTPLCMPPGSVHFYHREGSTWSLANRVSGDFDVDDAFGISVALAGDFAVVGAPQDGIGDCTFNGGYGAAYVFRWDGQDWIGLEKYVPDPDSVPWGNRFGHFVAFDGEWAIGAAVRGVTKDFVFIAGGPDCNANGGPDACDLLEGGSEDQDGDGVPDECQPGACCDTFTGTCTEPAEEAGCTGEYLVYYENTACAAVQCVQALGACCNTLTGACLVHMIGPSCVGADLVWTAEASCAEVGCAPATGACCDRETGECIDNLLSAECAGDTLDWHRDQLCFEIDCQPPFMAVPAVSAWGLLALALVFLILGKAGSRGRLVAR